MKDSLLVRFMEKRLLCYCRRHFDNSLGAEHGPSHWARVAAFGDILCDSCPEADRLVVHAFAYLHDIMRADNLVDAEHGLRAATLVSKLRYSYLLYLSDRQIELLKKACFYHTNVQTTSSPTVNICMDADRMDLPRGGIVPVPARMASREGAAIVSREDYIDAIWKLVDRNTV